VDESIEDKRNAIKTAYPNDTWAAKVDSMPDHQIIALYFRLRNQKKI
jgi:hypothetical protein